MHEADLLSNIGIAIVVANAFALLAKACRQPILLAYLATGIFLGPDMGLGWVKDPESIALISEIGLILLLFIIGLEIDLKKLLASGKTLIVSGISQFLLCTALGIAFFSAFGFHLREGRFDALYLAVAMALSSTMIVVKLLYDKFELATLPGRITLGILVFQDIWAILFLSLQPSLLTPRTSFILLSFVKGAGLVALALLLSRYFLTRLFSWIAKIPELLLVTAIAWCFLVSGIAGALGLSREMGALVAGVSLSTFPYNIDVIAKVINIRDFFVTLFFVGLGLQIPVPTGPLMIHALAASLFLILTRFFSIFPVLFFLRNGLRASLIPSINLAQMSEFSLVIASLGLAFQHIDKEVVGILTFVFAITSVLSTYMIQYNHEIQGIIAPILLRLGLHDRDRLDSASHSPETSKDIVFLGFFREASSIFHEMESMEDAAGRPLTSQVVVVDFNPVVHEELNKRGVNCIYGDISSVDTLKHAHLESVKVVVSSIPDSILRGITNLRILQLARRIFPQTRVIVAANLLQTARQLYEAGADFVYIPRIHSARQMAEIIATASTQSFDPLRTDQMRDLRGRNEILP
ncbi:MAG: sodium:proton exchanger [Deltaproteobacteria bacterium]|nr:sodium:proton exchanger [Deltaproteobacteria bacterium]